MPEPLMRRMRRSSRLTCCFSSATTHPDAQYCQTARLVRGICDRWDIPCDRDHIIGHAEANAMYCHGSHTDPGPGWDWDTFMGYVSRGGCDACTPTTEVCDGHDNDCDGMVDEGVANDCGGCGRTPHEVCDGHDNDCDGSVDEGLLNDCGGCGGGAPPQDAFPPHDDGGVGDAGGPKSDAGVPHGDAGPTLTPMQPGCDAAGAPASSSGTAWTMLALLGMAAFARSIRRRA